MSKRRLIPCGLFLCCAFAMALPARAASDIFVQVEGIPGESTDVKHKGWIEVLSFSTGVTQSGAAGAKMGAGGGTGKADIAPFTITKSVDGSTPRLFGAACGGTHIKRVIVEVVSAGESKHVFLKYTLNDVIVSSVRTSGAGNSESKTPMEEVTFSFAKIEMEYTPQDASGKAGAPVKASWDMTTNKAVSSPPPPAGSDTTASSGGTAAPAGAPAPAAGEPAPAAPAASGAPAGSPAPAASAGGDAAAAAPASGEPKTLTRAQRDRLRAKGAADAPAVVEPAAPAPAPGPAPARAPVKRR